jgi:hypothetical protein
MVRFIFQGLIFGKATHVIWPPERWTKIEPELPEVQGRKIEYLSNGKITVTNASKGD